MGGVATRDSLGVAGGGVFNRGTLTLTNSTLSGNSAGSSGGGVYNYGALTLARTLVSGNAIFRGPEIFNFRGYVTADNFNLFGYDGNTGVFGFSPGPTDVVPSQSLSAILAPLGDNGGSTLTHALNRTTGHWYSEKLFENTLAVRSERSRPGGEVEEQAGHEFGGLRLRCAPLRPHGKSLTACEQVYESSVV